VLEPFKIEIPETVLTDISVRLASARVPPNEASNWDSGTNPAYLRELIDYWKADFDWRSQEALINRFQHYRVMVDGTKVHLIHEKGCGQSPLPIILTHGYPDSFFRFYKLIPLLTEPAKHGGNPEDSFDVVVPSLPGYGFSDPR
jgi:pimeloyl-ACP methyl ester carboxylesterase